MSAELQCHSDAELLHGSSDDADRPTQRQPLFARKLTHSVVLAVSCGAILALASLGVASHWSGQSGSRASVRIRGATTLDDLGNLVDDVKDAADDAVDEAQDAADDVVEKPPGGDVAEDADEVVDDMMRMTSRRMRTRSSTMPKMLPMTSRISCRAVMWRRMRTRSSTTLKMMRMTSRRMRTRSSTMPKMLRMTSRRSCPVVTPKVMRMTSQRSCWVVTTLRLRRRRRRSCVSTSSSGAGDGSWRSP
ncbi:unnamed protein product [Prorocentrum cordatum]|uniref:Uncharacterized protein n=1 Tax=Prorocentrum cordatum TaxID=2364126 RepID=A0ABN9XNA6_9DINO|nr:unnamed protein product [Polarella glacialis]